MSMCFWNIRQTRSRQRGFTLIELMIVVVIVGILAAIAYPSYQNSVRKSRRADGKTELLETAQRLERCYTRFSSYADKECEVTFPFTSSEEYYEISTNKAITASQFELKATPQKDQANDTECGILTLTSTGAQGSKGSVTSDANECW